MCMRWLVMEVENPTGIEKDICPLSLQKVLNTETLTEADEAAVSVVVSGKTEWHHYHSPAQCRLQNKENNCLFIKGIDKQGVLC